MQIISVPALVRSDRHISNASNFERRFLGRSPCNIKPWGRLMEKKGKSLSIPCPRGRKCAWLLLLQGYNEGDSRPVWQREPGTWHTGMKVDCELDLNWLSVSNFLWVMKLLLNRKLLECWFHIQFQLGMILNACNGYSSGPSSAHRGVLCTSAIISFRQHQDCSVMLGLISNHSSLKRGVGL